MSFKTFYFLSITKVTKKTEEREREREFCSSSFWSFALLWLRDLSHQSSENHHSHHHYLLDFFLFCFKKLSKVSIYGFLIFFYRSII